MIFIFIVVALVCFGVLILVHELGHFFAAKRAGIRVTEFAIGMGLAIFKHQRGDTLYSLRIFPLGGFCQMEGDEEDSDSPDAFGNKPILSRVAVIIMGSLMNLLLGFLIILALGAAADGFATTTVDKFREGETPSLERGLLPGDRIVKLNNERVNITEDILFFLSRHDGSAVDITALRDGQEVLISAVYFPYTDVNREELSGDYRDEGNVHRLYRTDFYVTREENTPGVLIVRSFYRCFSIVKMVWQSLFDLFGGKVPVTDMSGPVGITNVLGEAAQNSLADLLNILALLSINLGVLNMLPLPALDGGRLVFLMIEAIIRRPVPAKYEGYIHYGGFVLLIGFSIFVAFNDVIRLMFRG